MDDLDDTEEASEDIINAFSDVTEHLPVDLLRSLQLIRKLDDESTFCINQLDDLALTVSTTQPEQYLQMAQLLKTSTKNRSITLTEACKLYEIVKKHLHTIEQTLQDLQEAWQKRQQIKTPTTHTAEIKPSNKKQSKKVPVEEPRYCFCNQVSYGRMIACDNNNCEREWFHWDCVHLSSAPKGKWTCSDECAFAIGHKQKKKF